MPRYLYVDFETTVSKSVSLRKMTLRQYLSHTRVLGLAFALDDGPVEWVSADHEGRIPEQIHEHLLSLAEDPGTVLVAHNAAFDSRVWRLLLDLPTPDAVHCTLELAQAAWPNQPGGYGLESLSRTLNLGFAKLGDGAKVMAMTPTELAAYCRNDVELCRSIHKAALPHLTSREIRVSELANKVRELWLEVNQGAIALADDGFAEVVAEQAQALVDNVGAGGDQVFGWEAGRVKSVKPHELKSLLMDQFAFDTPTISYKKLNPEHLRRADPAVGVALKAAEKANKALSHQRRVRVFSGSPQIDMELGYFRAHTGRFSSPSVGRGLNLHNLPKRDKRLAKLIRSLFRLPKGACFVRADLANVEYRVEGWLTGCDHIARLFSENIFADPYAAFWYVATGQRITKSDPARQIAKAAVLGLGYHMSIGRWMEEILRVLADFATYQVKLSDLADVCSAMGWGPPSSAYVRRCMTRSNAPWEVAAVAENTHRLFHEIHPEFGRVTRWLELAVSRLNQCFDRDQAERMLDLLYGMPSAPARDKIELRWSSQFEGRSVQVVCGQWDQPTVTWRDLDVRVQDNGGACLTFMNGRKGYLPLTKNILIENITQSAARNGLCAGLLRMESDYGYQHLLHVHDEIMPVVPSTPGDVLDARDALTAVFGPMASPGWGWSVCINPAEISVSQSLYEDDKLCSKTWWSQLEAGDASLLEALP